MNKKIELMKNNKSMYVHISGGQKSSPPMHIGL